MSDVTLFGFPRSTFVKVAGLILTARNVEYRFHDTEEEMYLPVHLERHPFGRVPALQHGDFMLYETNAIAAYVDEVFPGAKLTPADPRKRARMNQWIGNLNWYFYPEMIYHVTHERLVYPELGIPGNDLIVQRAIPKVIRALEVMEQELSAGGQASAAEISPHRRLGQSHGRIADGRALQRHAAAAPPDRTRARMGEAPPAGGVAPTAFSAAPTGRAEVPPRPNACDRATRPGRPTPPAITPAAARGLCV